MTYEGFIRTALGMVLAFSIGYQAARWQASNVANNQTTSVVAEAVIKSLDEAFEQHQEISDVAWDENVDKLVKGIRDLPSRQTTNHVSSPEDQSRPSYGNLGYYIR